MAGFKIVMGSERHLCFESWGGETHMTFLIKVFLSDCIFSLSWHYETVFQKVGLRDGVLFSPFSAFTKQPLGKGFGSGMLASTCTVAYPFHHVLKGMS